MTTTITKQVDLLLTKALVWQEQLNSNELTTLGTNLLAMSLDELATFAEHWQGWIVPSLHNYYRNPEVTQVPLRLVDTCVWWQWKRRNTR